MFEKADDPVDVLLLESDASGSTSGESNPTVVASLQSSAEVLGWLAVAVGSVVLVVGWWLEADIVARVIPGSVTMKANTAVGIAAAGLAIVAQCRGALGWRRMVALLAAALVTIIGWVTVTEYAMGITWTGFDEILATEGPSAIATSNPGRMGANTAFNYSLLGPALFMLMSGGGTRTRQVLAMAVTSVGFTAIIGYALGVSQLAGVVGGATQMAINTSILHVSLGLAIVFIDPAEGLMQPLVSKRAGGTILRLYIPVTAVLALLAAVLFERGLAPLIDDQRFTAQLVEATLVFGMVAVIVSIGTRVNRLDKHAESVGRDRMEIVKANRQLETLLDSRDQLIAAVSHEIRTPLTGMIGFAEILRSTESEYSDTERQDMITSIASQGADLAHIVDDLLTASKSRLGDLVISRGPVNLDEQVALVLELAEGTDVEVEMTGDLSVVALGDPVRVRQVLRNLVTNAVRHGGDSIWVNTGRTTTAAIVQVSDDGPEIPADRRDAIFEAYERAGPNPGLTGSLGLGLTISRNLARAMKGNLNYERSDDRNTFELRLDLAP